MSAPILADDAKSNALVESMIRIAEQAGQSILGYYGDDIEIQVRHKQDNSPLTDADEAAEALILAALAELTPDIPVVSEEAASVGHIPKISGSHFWLVDPLDGTKEFISRNGEFTVNIALIEDGQPIAGVVHAPALGRTWAGAQAPGQAGSATLSENDRPSAQISVRQPPDTGILVVASRRHGDGAELDSFLADYRVADTLSAGSSIKFCLVASGEADLYPRFGRTMEWDTAAGHAVLLAAGGQVRTTAGIPLTYGKPGFENPHFIASSGI